VIWESWPWKRELARLAAKMRRRMVQRRWSEASLAILERDVFVTGFAIRKLLDSHKLSDEAESIGIPATAHAARGRAVDIMNWHRIDELYDLGASHKLVISLRKFCDQVVHSFVFVPETDEGTGLQGFFLTSDRCKAERLLYFDIEDVVKAMERISADDIVSMETYREKVGDEMKIVRKSSKVPRDS
jgi:hypothetical protein